MTHGEEGKQVPCISGFHTFSGGMHRSHISKILVMKRIFMTAIATQIMSFTRRPTILSRVIAKEVLLKVTARILKVPSIAMSGGSRLRLSGGMSFACLPKSNWTRYVTTEVQMRRDTYRLSLTKGLRRA